jgi:hypothetical protein
MQRFTHVLRKQNTSLEEMPGLDDMADRCVDEFNPNNRLHPLLSKQVQRDLFPVIRNLLDRNVSIRRSKQLLALQPRTGGRPIASSKSGIWYKALSKLTRRDDAYKKMYRLMIYQTTTLCAKEDDNAKMCGSQKKRHQALVMFTQRHQVPVSGPC